MKFRLLNDGGYGGMGNVKFPVEVEARVWRLGCEVYVAELYRVGADAGFFDYFVVLPFMNNLECEAVENE